MADLEKSAWDETQAILASINRHTRCHDSADLHRARMAIYPEQDNAVYLVKLYASATTWEDLL